MKGFQLDRSGDIVIKDSKIQFAFNEELVRQTVETVIGTNNGEWFLNEDEGINFRAILKKSPNMDLVRNEIQKGILQVDSSLFIQEFEYDIDNRTLNIKFTASNGENIVEGGISYAR